MYSVSLKSKFKLHKIPTVDLDVCSCEQMTAYNLASSERSRNIDEYRAASELDKYSICNRIVDRCISTYVQWCLSDLDIGVKCKPYDINAIYYALHAGMRRYLDSCRSILGSYDDVGQIFNLND